MRGRSHIGNHTGMNAARATPAAAPDDSISVTMYRRVSELAKKKTKAPLRLAPCPFLSFNFFDAAYQVS